MDLRALRSQVHNVAWIWEGRERAGGKEGWRQDGGEEGIERKEEGEEVGEMGEGGVELKGEWCHLHTC